MSTSIVHAVLENATNGAHSPTSSLTLGTAKTGPVLRHKPTQHLLPNLDSSESYPSPHSSIYEASVIYHSFENLPTDDSAAPSTNTIQDPPAWANLTIDPSGNAVPISFLDVPDPHRIHTPHKLCPITEQNSLATLRSSHLSVSTLRPRSPGLRGRKAKSFSLSDLPRTPSPIVDATPPSPPPSPLPHDPIQPHHPPPTRMPTPPGLPTFNQPEASNYRLPPPQTRFRDKFRSPTPEEREWHRQTVGLPKGVVMRGDNGVLVRGKFTPVKSGHLPPQRQQHALFRTPNVAGGIQDAGVGSTRSRAEPADERARVAEHEYGREFENGSVRSRQAVAAGGARTNEAAAPRLTMAEVLKVQQKKRQEERIQKRLKRRHRFSSCCGLCKKKGGN
ncbi:hypothetical protein MMC28_004357 [Mycoblastus sanguinarius]|nr:hypothetical protein [Mycoblastus sanguinarius]